MARVRVLWLTTWLNAGCNYLLFDLFHCRP